MCTRILWNTNGVVTSVGRTMDWAESTEPKVYVFPRGIPRHGGKGGPNDVIPENPAQWTSKYGSVVVSAYGLASVDGVNEKGLGMHLLFLTATDFGPRDPSRAGVHAGLWGQYLLDNASTVEEALRLMQDIQPVMVEHGGHRTTLHLAIEDATDDSALIEYADGQPKIYHGPEHRVMTNDPPYDEQLLELKKWNFAEATRDTPLPGNVNPIDRFVRANYFLQTLRKPQNERAAIATVFSIARNASVPFNAPYKTVETIYDTEYRTVINLEARRYFFELTTSPNVIYRFALFVGWIPYARRIVHSNRHGLSKPINALGRGSRRRRAWLESWCWRFSVSTRRPDDGRRPGRMDPPRVHR